MTRPGRPPRVVRAMLRSTLVLSLPLLLTAAPAPVPAFTVTAGGARIHAATVDEALASARRLRGGGTVTITFPPGLLRLTAPIALDARDRGLVLAAAPGGTTLSGAAIVAPAGAARVADPRAAALPGYRFGSPDQPSLPQLYAGRERLRLASWPGEGYRTGWRIEQTAAGPLLRATGAALPPIAGPVLVSGYFGPGWAWDAIPARAQDGGLLLARTPEFGIAETARLRISGALPLAPRRYAPDANGARLSPAAAPVELARLPTLLTLDHAAGVRIDGLAFERSAGTAIRIDESTDVRLTGCTIRQTGDRAVQVTGGERVTIERCRIDETGGSAVFVSAGRRAGLEPSGDAILGTTVSRWGEGAPTAAGVVVWGVGTLVRGNRLAGGEGTALNLQGNEHRIEGNEIAWAVCQADDAGAVYMGRDWTQRGMVIADNFIHDIGGARDVQAAGVYLDDQASGATVTRNAFVRVPFGVLLGGGRDNRIEANLFATLSKAAVMFDARGTTWAKALSQPGGALLTNLAAMPYRNALWRKRYPALAALPEDRAAEPVGNVLRGNARIEAQPVWDMTPGYSLAVEDDRTPPPTAADRAALATPDRAWPVLARLGGLDPDPAWRTTPATGMVACPR